MLRTFLILSFAHAGEALDRADERNAWTILTHRRPAVKAEAEWRDGHIHRAYLTGLDDQDCLTVACLHWAVKVLASGKDLTPEGVLRLVPMKRLRYLSLWGDQFAPMFTGRTPPPFTVNRPDVKLRLYWNCDGFVVDAEKGQSILEDMAEEERRKDSANRPPPDSIQ